MFSHRFAGWGYATAFLVFSSFTAVDGNPSGGTVAGGTASISGTGTGSVTINQTSNTAVINWNSFSINNGELTTFLQPGSSSAVLNRVTGGSVSNIDGTLNANGQVFLINGNGVLVGSGGVINTAGFVGSTLDISNKDFTAGKYQYSGTSANGVKNLGTINALGGNLSHRPYRGQRRFPQRRRWHSWSRRRQQCFDQAVGHRTSFCKSGQDTGQQRGG